MLLILTSRNTAARDFKPLLAKDFKTSKLKKESEHIRQESEQERGGLAYCHALVRVASRREDHPHGFASFPSRQSQDGNWTHQIENLVWCFTVYSSASRTQVNSEFWLLTNVFFIVKNNIQQLFCFQAEDLGIEANMAFSRNSGTARLLAEWHARKEKIALGAGEQGAF